MSDSVALLATAAGAGTLGILLCSLLAAVELRVQRHRHGLRSDGALPPDLQRLAWDHTGRGTALVGIALLLVFVHAAGVGWLAIAAIVSYLIGAHLRVRQANADINR